MIDYYNSNPKDIIACIGPAIWKCHFEVDEDVKNIFQTTFSYNNIIEKGKIKDWKQKYLIDTNLINRKLSEDIWLNWENIIESKICTVCNSKKTHSYRTDKNKSWRSTAVIGLIN